MSVVYLYLIYLGFFSPRNSFFLVICNVLFFSSAKNLIYVMGSIKYSMFIEKTAQIN